MQQILKHNNIIRMDGKLFASAPFASPFIRNEIWKVNLSVYEEAKYAQRNEKREKSRRGCKDLEVDNQPQCCARTFCRPPAAQKFNYGARIRPTMHTPATITKVSLLQLVTSVLRLDCWPLKKRKAHAQLMLERRMIRQLNSFYCMSFSMHA